MALIAIPDQDALEVTAIDLDVPQQVNRSGWTSRRKVVGLPGASRWLLSFVVDALATLNDERPWRAFVVMAKGQGNIFDVQVACSQRVGTNPTVRTGATAGNTLPLQGLPASATPLKLGDYMTVPLPSGHHRTVMLTADLTTNGSGQGTATFEPDLGEVPTVGATVETIDPYIRVASASSRNGWQTKDGVTAIAFDCEEAL